MRRIFIVVSAIVAVIAMNAESGTSFGNAKKFNNDWRFQLADSVVTEEEEYVDSLWRRVTLPHDWSIEELPAPTLNSCTGYYPGGIGWYRKEFTLPADADPVQYVYFEGVYNRSDVYLNGHRLGHRPNGYVSFAYDMTPYLNPPGTPNVLAVRVDHSREADSRWYTGSGIYRDVYLVGAQRAHFDLWGVGWKTSDVTDKSATVTVDVRVKDDNAIAGKLTVAAEIIDAEGKIVASGRKSVKPDEREEITLKLKSPKRWDVDLPYLYSLKTVLMRDGKAVDETSVPLGVRTLKFDANTGFELNGRNMKVKGVCLHHDAGGFGAAVPRQIWRTRLINLKKMGANAIRMSHNPQAPMVYDLCDELGLLVMDEISDEWEFPKRKWVKGWNVGTPKFEGTYDFFEEWIDRDVTDMVRRDRNHPCVFMWSIGNEVDYPNDPYSHPVLDGDNSAISQPMFGGYNPDAPRAERIGLIAKRLASNVRDVDTSRPVTGALAGVVMSNETEYPEAVDAVGYNYTEKRYAEDHATYPDRIIYGSENGQSYSAWLAVRDTPYIFGQFIWTGADYLGESGSWPSRGLGTGLLGFDNFPKGNAKFRESLWADHPVAYLGAYQSFPGRWGNYVNTGAPAVWNFDDDANTTVVCYTNAPEAELKLNGESLGRKAMVDSVGVISWKVPFEPGRLTVEAFGADGAVIATDTLATSGRPYALRASVLDNTDGLYQILVEVVDEDGTIVKLADNEISCRVGDRRMPMGFFGRRGRRQNETPEPVRLLGMENADNRDMSSHRDNRERAYQGTVVAYIMADEGAKATNVTFTSPLLQSAQLTINPE